MRIPGIRNQDSGVRSGAGNPHQVIIAACQRTIFVLLLLVSGLLCSCAQPAAQSAAQPAAPPYRGLLQITATAEAEAGAPVSVLVTGDAPDGTEVNLTALGSFGPQVYRGSFHSGAVAFALPAADTRNAGVLSLVATAGTARADATLTLRAGPAATVAQPLISPRSICVGATELSIVAVLAMDAYGNLLADDTPVTLQARRPGGDTSLRELRSAGGLAWARIASGTRAGRSSAWAQAGDRHSAETPLSEVACVPTSFTLLAEPNSTPADGRGYVTIHTSLIRDRFGNVIPDGTLVTFLVDVPDAGTRRIPALTLNGVAEAVVQAPRSAGKAVVQAVLHGATSAPLTVVFTEAT